MIRNYFYLFLAFILPISAQAATNFPIPLTASNLNADIRTWSNGSVYTGFMNGSQTFGGVPFSMLTSANGSNVIWATSTSVFSVSNNTTYTNVVTLSTELYGATKVYTLINTAFGTFGATVGSIRFNASDGTSYTVNLVVGTNVRDHYFGGSVNTVSANYVTLNVLGNNNNNTAHLDMQSFSLPVSFSTKTLTSIVFTSSGSTNTGIPFLAGLTVNAADLPTLIAYYNMDENSWNGTLNETKDSAGYTGGPFDGQGIGSPKPTAASINPAKAGANGTCGYATLSGLTTNGSGFTLDGLPLDTSAGANTTVSFWMLWNGTNYVQPLGWNLYNLFFSDGKFGFNTGSYDIWGINSAGLANGWHHVVAVFNNGNVSNSQLYIDGVSQTLSQTNGSQIANSSAYVQSVLQVSGWTYDNAWRFVGGRIDEVKVYKGTLTQTQVTADYTAVHACAGFNVIPVNFNCVAVGAASNTGHLYTQDTASSFNFDVAALKADGTVETNYVASGSKNVTVEFVDGTGNTACSSRASINPAVSQSVTFSASDAGRKTISASITKAYRDLRCRVTDANQSPSVIGCSSDDFAVRPTSFTVSSNANADSTGTNVTATPTVKAGANFSMTAATGVAGYDGTPSIDNTKLSAHLGATQIGTLTGGFGAASTASGNATGAAFNYSEAGYFKFATNGVYDSSFTAVDSANGDCATGFSASGGKNACSFGNNSNTNYFGRFIPDHFVITPGTTTPSCGANFSYFGQDGFTTGFTLIAQNSSNSVTQNYTGGFAKLGLSTWSNYQFTAASLPLGATLSASATLPTGTWNNGSATVLAQHLISRPASAASPTSITISAAPVDSDGVTAASTAVSAASVFRYGRLAMPNIYGSELLPLTANIEAQYWNGTAYQRNQLDNCSVVTLSSIAMGNYKSNLNACETQLSGAGTMVNGKSLVVLSKPGAGNNGSVDLSVNLNTASGATCNSNVATTATSAAIPWFGNANPNARATFGIYKSPVIYLRENF